MSVRSNSFTNHYNPALYEPTPDENLGGMNARHFSHGAPNDVARERKIEEINNELDSLSLSICRQRRPDLPVYRIYDTSFRELGQNLLHRIQPNPRKIAVIGPGKNTPEVLTIAGCFPNAALTLVEPYNGSQLQEGLELMLPDLLTQARYDSFEIITDTIQEAHIEKGSVDLVYAYGVFQKPIITKRSDYERISLALDAISADLACMVLGHPSPQFVTYLCALGWQVSALDREDNFIVMKRDLDIAQQPALTRYKNLKPLERSDIRRDRHNNWSEYSSGNITIAICRSTVDSMYDVLRVDFLPETYMFLSPRYIHAFYDECNSQIILDGPSEETPLYRIKLGKNETPQLTISERLLFMIQHREQHQLFSSVDSEWYFLFEPLIQGIKNGELPNQTVVTTSDILHNKYTTTFEVIYSASH